MEESGVGDPPLLLTQVCTCYKSNIYCCCFLQLVYVTNNKVKEAQVGFRRGYSANWYFFVCKLWCKSIYLGIAQLIRPAGVIIIMYFKSLLETERYLSLDLLSKQRYSLWEFRCTSHTLHVEVDRHTGVEQSQRICSHCLLFNNLRVVDCE